MKKVVREEPQITTINNISREKVYIIECKLPKRIEHVLIHPVDGETNKCGCICIDSFTKGTKYVTEHQQLCGLISCALRTGDDVFEFDSIKEALIYLVNNIVD